MKILAIRGKNLASLVGEFVLDFQQEPLISAGLFAISGPTGAGKSTLLDALCLALYNKTPRLQQAGSKGIYLPDVGSETLSPHDVRCLLRRGAVEGYAEVDFTGHDGNIYRSRWSVSRAHGKVNGKLRNAQMTLIRVNDQQRLGSTNSETLNEIQRCLGLSFEQFSRAVLLAQNEFSIFLKAPDDERAALLEALTDTDQYSQISMRAFERAKQEKMQLEVLNLQQAQYQPLDPEARQALETQKLAHTHTLANLAQQKTVVDGYLQWHHRHQELLQAEKLALVQLEKSQFDVQQAAQRRELLQMLEAVQDARALLADWDRLQQEFAQSNVQLQAQEAVVILAKTALQDAQRCHQQALLQSAEAERRKSQAAADIQLASNLDTEITALTPNHLHLQQTLAACEQAAQTVQQELNSKHTEKHTVEQNLAQTQQWLEQHVHLTLLSQQWPRWDRSFGQAGAFKAQLEEAQKQSRAHAENRAAVIQNQQGLQKQLEQLQLEVTKAGQQLLLAEQSAAMYDLAALTLINQYQQQRQTQLRQAEIIFSTLHKLTESIDGQSAKLQQTIQQRNEQTEQLHAIQQTLPVLKGQYEQAQKMFDLAKTACSQSVEKLRATLEEDVECPVCGSKTHPFGRDQHPFREELGLLEVEMSTCQLKLKQAEQAEQHASIALAQREAQVTELHTTLTTLADERAQQLNVWATLALHDELNDVDISKLGQWLQEQIAHADRLLKQSNADLHSYSEAQQHLTTSRQTAERLRTQQAALQAQFDHATTQSREIEFAFKQSSDAMLNIQALLNQQLQELDAAFGHQDWREQWLSAPDRYHRDCQDQTEQWQKQQESQQRLQAAIVLLNEQFNNLQERRQQTHEQLVAAKSRFTESDLTLKTKQQERWAIFADRPITEVELELEQNLTSAKQSLHSAGEVMQDLQSKLAASLEVALQTRQQQEALLDRSNSAEQLVSAWLTQFNQSRHYSQPLEVTHLRHFLEQGTDKIITERQALASLQEALTQAQTIFNERHQQRASHINSSMTGDSLEQLQAQWNDLEKLNKEHLQQLTELELQLRNDDERLKKGTEIQQKIRAQSAVTETWNKLNQLIGSADGKKFRNIAQQITLDILLGYANQHLKDLNRRYRLGRISETLALQVVDREMGNEIRSVHSLSGGESFLLSLALALGLASLSSNRVRVESLFIDEGFGSLDADTLRITLDALDNLQALGRKVGVISHVQDMTERISTRVQVNRVSGGMSKIVVCSN